MTTTDRPVTERTATGPGPEAEREYGGLLRTALDHVLPRLSALYAAATGHRRGLLAASVVRIGYGLVLVGLLLTNLPMVDRLWGPDGQFGHEAFLRSLERNHSFSLWALSDSPTWNRVLYLATFLAAVLFLVGWRTRIVTPVLWLLYFSLGTRNPTVLDGGDNILDITLVYLCLVQCSARLSLDARRRRRQGRPDPEVGTGTPGRFLGTVLHNAGVALFVFQVCTVYLVAGMNKVQGTEWQNGTAIYYILRISEFNNFPELTRLLYLHAPLVVLVTYLTVLLQISFPFLLLNRVSRHVAFFVAAVMHLGIAVLMGLPFFSAVMLVSDILIFADAELLAIRDQVLGRIRHRRGRRAAARQPRSNRMRGPASVVSSAREVMPSER